MNATPSTFDTPMQDIDVSTYDSNLRNSNNQELELLRSTVRHLLPTSQNRDSEN